MKQLWPIVSAALIAAAAGAVSAAPAVTGDYLEARSCNVFAGPCHYGSEFTTAGREAVLAWHVRRGASAGQSLDGLSAVAAVVADENLAVSGPRRTVLYVDERATPAQRDALVSLLRERTGVEFGKMVRVQPAAIRFETDADGTHVAVPRIARIDATKMPDAACCRWPGERWYDPLARTTSVNVGNASVNEYDDSLLNVRWQQRGQNSVLFGEFAL